MTGTVVVYAEAPALRRAGTFNVVIDGVKVGRVKQGSAVRFPVQAGSHAVGIAARDSTRSNTVLVEVAEGRDFLVTARSTGLWIALLLPWLAGFAVPRYYAVATILLMGVLFFAVPGLLFRVRADGDPELKAAGGAGPAEAAQAPGEPQSGSGLWWESDPVLAKRFRKRAGS